MLRPTLLRHCVCLMLNSKYTIKSHYLFLVPISLFNCSDFFISIILHYFTYCYIETEQFKNHRLFPVSLLTQQHASNLFFATLTDLSPATNPILRCPHERVGASVRVYCSYAPQLSGAIWTSWRRRTWFIKSCSFWHVPATMRFPKGDDLRLEELNCNLLNGLLKE